MEMKTTLSDLSQHGPDSGASVTFDRVTENECIVPLKDITTPVVELTPLASSHSPLKELQPLNPNERLIVELRPFKHQVGGHTCVLEIGRDVICKPLADKEQLFYERTPDSLRQFIPKYIGRYCFYSSVG